jgi:hypothetical protein
MRLTLNAFLAPAVSCRHPAGRVRIPGGFSHGGWSVTKTSRWPWPAGLHPARICRRSDSPGK